MTKSKGMYPDAHPTAPGGMSRKALIKELVDVHGFEDSPAWGDVSWPDLIDLVVEERLAREAEADATLAQQVMAEHEGESVGAVEEALVDAGLDPSDEVVEEALAAHERAKAKNEEVSKVEWEDELPAHIEESMADPEYAAAPSVEAMFEDMDDLDQMLAEVGLADEPKAEPEPITLPVCEGVDMVLLPPKPEPVETQDPAEYEAALGEYDTTDADDPEAEAIIDPEQMFAEMAAAKAAEDATKPPPLFIGIPGIKDYIFDNHAGAGPSAAERWMNCTMSLSASRRFLETLTPNQQREFAKSGTAARQGTTAHNAAEVEANFVLGRVSEEEVEHTLTELTFFPEAEDEAYDEEMGEYITEYVDLVRSYAQERGPEHVLIEARVEAAIPLTDMHEGEVYVVRGSGDCIGLPTPEEPTLVVGDLKYGNGIDVGVDENPQIRLYALGALGLLVDDEGEFITEFPVEEVVYHIIQPRLGGIKTWRESLDDLLRWRDEVLAPALTKALYGADEGATYEPSELACQWCPARGACPALAESRVEAAQQLFDTIVETEFAHGPGAFPETESLSDTRLGELLTQITGLVDLKDHLKDEVQRRLHRGGTVPGYHLVSYTPPRKWKAAAEEALAEVAEVWQDPKLVTPTQALKVIKDDAETLALIEPLIDVPAKRPVAARTTDRRRAWTGVPPEQMFADESDTEEVAGS